MNCEHCWSADARQVLRTLMTMGVEFGSVPLARRPPPADVVGPEAQPLVQQLAELAQAAMQVRGLRSDSGCNAMIRNMSSPVARG